MKFQLSDTIWWWIERWGEAPFEKHLFSLNCLNLAQHYQKSFRLLETSRCWLCIFGWATQKSSLICNDANCKWVLRLCRTRAMVQKLGGRWSQSRDRFIVRLRVSGPLVMGTPGLATIMVWLELQAEIKQSFAKISQSRRLLLGLIRDRVWLA